MKPRSPTWTRGVLGLALLIGLLLCAGVAGGAENLVKARFRTQTDSGGFPYTVDAYGRVQGQFGWLLSGYQVNRSGFSSSTQLMKPDGSEYVLEGRAGALVVRRRFRVSRSHAGIRIVDSVVNSSGNAQAVTLSLYSQPSYRYTRVVTDKLTAIGGALDKKSSGVVCLLQPPMQGMLLYHLTAPGNPVRPSVQPQNNQALQVHYSFTAAAGSTTSVAYTIAVRRDAAMPDAKTLASYIRPYASRRYLGDLPRDLRRSVVNLRRRGLLWMEGVGGMPSLEALLDITPASLDQLAFSEETLLQGTATCDSVVVESEHGTVTVPFARVAALVGARNTQYVPQVHLRDGQILVGTIRTEGLQFAMTSGLAVDLDLERLDRLVLRGAPATYADEAAGNGETPPSEGDPQGYHLVETFTGNRLRAQPESTALSVATPWGVLDVPVSELLGLHLAGDELPGYWVALKDRSRFRAFLVGAKLQMRTALFGSVPFAPHNLRRVLYVPPTTKRADAEDKTDELLHPHLLLVGGDIVVGRIDADALEFLGPGGVVPQPPAQIRLLRNEAEGQLPGEGEEVRFRAEIWGGGHLTGELRESVLRVLTSRGVLRVPARDLLEAHVPTPLVPEVLRVRLRGLVRDLGHADWKQREAASKALEEMGELARIALQTALRETKDPEVERRLRRLLDRL